MCAAELWKVEGGELAEIFDREGVVGERSSNCVREFPDLFLLAGPHDNCPPLIRGRDPRHSVIAGLVLVWPSLIEEVLLVGTEAQVGAPVVQTVSVDVIDRDAIGRLKDQSVHQGPPAAPANPKIRLRVPRVSARAGMPGVAQHELHILVVYEDHHPVGKQDFSHARHH